MLHFVRIVQQTGIQINRNNKVALSVQQEIQMKVPPSAKSALRADTWTQQMDVCAKIVPKDILVHMERISVMNVLLVDLLLITIQEIRPKRKVVICVVLVNMAIQKQSLRIVCLPTQLAQRVQQLRTLPQKAWRM
jgi:hypothetical protein